MLDPTHPGLRDAQAARILAASIPDIAARARALVHAFGPGAHGRRRAGPGDAFWQYRRILPGESAADIDWRATAKAGMPYARDREWVAPAEAVLLIDPTPSMNWSSRPGLETKAVRARLLALALACLLLDAGESVAWGGIDAPAARTPQGLEGLAQALAHADSTGSSLAPWGLGRARAGRCAVLSDLLDDPVATAEGIKNLAAQGLRGHLAMILDPAEAHFPWQGRRVLLGVEDGCQILAEDAAALQEHYLKALDRHTRAVAEAAQGAGWTFSIHTTDRPALEGLLPLRASFEHEDHHPTWATRTTERFEG